MTGTHHRVGHALLAIVGLSLIVLGCSADGSLSGHSDRSQLGRIASMRRLTETQYRNSIADIFGPDIKVAGRFEPIVRPAHHLIATGAGSSGVSPAGFEQFDAMARNIAGQVFDATHRPFFANCAPQTAIAADADCARKILVPIGRYVFRRPLTATEAASYVQIAGHAATQTGSFDAGLQLSLAAMLVSPNFLYVIETAEPDPDHPSRLMLDNSSRAARLSFLLWNTTPDDALLTAAEQGRLTRSEDLAAAADRLVEFPRLEAGVRAFFADMLLFEKFDDFAKDPVIYPRFNADVAKALPEQLLRMITDHLVTRDGDYRALFTTPRTFMTRVLGPVYNVPVRAASGWEPYAFGPDSDRIGLLGQAGFLALYSHSGRSSPTLRGRAIRELLLCQPVPNPPGNVNFTVVQDTTNAVLRTARARLTAHTNDPVCAGCHKITDPIGLPLEKFDGIGAFRRQENNADIDTNGTFEGTAFTGAAGLGKALAASPSTTECVVNRALEYATGRPMEDDTEATATIEKDFATEGYRLKALFRRIATLPASYVVPAVPGQTAQSSDALSIARMGVAP